MATIFPKSQEFFDLNDRTRGLTIGVSTIKLVSTSDTFGVPTLAEPTNDGSAKQLERRGDRTVEVTCLDLDNDGFYRTVRVSGQVGSEAIIVTLHEGYRNFNEEEDAV